MTEHPRSAILGIDCSGEIVDLFLHVSGADPQSLREVTRQTVEILSDRIQMICTNAQIEVKHISKVVVALGPGSYTGIRSAMAAAQGLAYGNHIELIGVPGLLAGLLETARGTGKYSVAIVARQNEYFEADYSVLEVDREGKASRVRCERSLGVRSSEKLGDEVILLRPEVSLSRGAVSAVSEGFVIEGERCPRLFPFDHGEVREVLEPLYVKGVNALTLKQRGKAQSQGH